MGNARPFRLPSLGKKLTFLQTTLLSSTKNGMSKMTINTKCSLNNVHFDQPAGLHRWHGTSESDRKDTLVGPMVLFGTFSSPQTGSPLWVWLTANSHAYVGDLNMAWQRAHLLHMPLVFNSEPYIGCQKCDTVVGSTTAPRYTEELPATELGLVSWPQELKHMGLNTEMNYYYHLPHITLLRSQ